MATDHTPIVVVTVGTDHHPFARLIGWVDAYVVARNAAHPDESIDVLCQHGTAPPIDAARSQPFIDHASLQRDLARADAVVSHCGPSTVLEALRLGRVPIVMPRLHRFGEAVDDHQVAFADFLLERGQIVLVGTIQELHRAIDRALADPAAFHAGVAPDDFVSPAASIERFAAIAGGLHPARRNALFRRLPRIHGAH